MRKGRLITLAGLALASFGCARPDPGINLKTKQDFYDKYQEIHTDAVSVMDGDVDSISIVNCERRDNDYADMDKLKTEYKEKFGFDMKSDYKMQTGKSIDETTDAPVRDKWQKKQSANQRQITR
jgi:hypothetical protein